MLFRTLNEIIIIGKTNFDANMLQAYPRERERERERERVAATVC
jgi:hypothetical protein